MLDTISVNTTHQGRLLTVEVLSVRDGNGAIHQREVVRHPGAVAVVPLLERPGHPDQLVLIRNFRVAVGRWLWEVPAGKLEPDEAPQTAADRELCEETGFRAATLQELGRFYTSPGFTDERMHVFLASGLEPGPQQLESGELVQVEAVDVEAVETMLIDGSIEDGKTLAAISLWQRLARRDGAAKDTVT